MGDNPEMPNPFPLSVGRVRQDRTLNSLAEELDSLSTDLLGNVSDEKTHVVTSLKADYQTTLAHRAAQFQESVSNMQSKTRTSVSALKAQRTITQQEDLSRGRFSVAPDRGFVEPVVSKNAKQPSNSDVHRS